MESLSNAASPDDDAGQRLVGDEKNGHKEKTVEVKYMTPDSQNGDAKIDIENIKSAFAGMGKEELMKFANDPFWVRTRWFLFVLFWLVWVAMLVGAILIIILAPKCSAPSPRNWWEQSPLYEVDIRNFKDGNEPQTGVGNIKGLTSKLDYLKNLGVKTVVVSSLLKSTNPLNASLEGSVEDYMQISPSVGTLDDLKALALAMKEKGLHLLMSFIPNHSSDQHEMFTKSINKEEPYTDFYVWAPKKLDENQKQIPPNNWKSLTGGSAWQWNEVRKEYYLHQFGASQPDFNFRNQKVVDYFKTVMKYWLENGISGFHLDKVQYLLEDKDLRDEPPVMTPKNTGAIHDEYKFYNHMYTSDLPELANVLEQWNQVPANNSGILTVTGGRSSIDSSVNASVGQLLVRPQYLDPEFSGYSLESLVKSTLGLSKWPTWEFSSKKEPFTEEIASGLLIVAMLLPGTPVTRSGAELGLVKPGPIPWNNSTNGGFSTADLWSPVGSSEKNVESEEANPDSYLNLYKTLVGLRDSASVLYGKTELKLLNNGTVFAFTRIKPGNPGYLVAYNVGPNPESVSLTDLEGVPKYGTVSARTVDLAANMTIKSKIGGSKVTLDPYSAVAVQFVPVKKD